MSLTRSPNLKLASVITECGWSHAQVARALVRVAEECSAPELSSVGRSHISHWVAGSVPSGRAPAILCETLARRLGRVVSPAEIGLPERRQGRGVIPDWAIDTLVTLADLGRVDVDVERRHVLTAATYSVTAFALPGPTWWTTMAERGAGRFRSGTPNVGRADVDAVRDTVSAFSRIDQRRGGGHARTAVVQYLTSDVAGYHRHAGQPCGGRRQARPGDDEPGRVFFFGEASLAHETGCTLRDCGDLPGAAREFRHSVRTRKATTFTRTHAVTLGYLGAVQIRQGLVDEACTTWSNSLMTMDGVRSARTRSVAGEMRSLLAPYRRRGHRMINEVDARAAAYMSLVG